MSNKKLLLLPAGILIGGLLFSLWNKDPHATRTCNNYKNNYDTKKPTGHRKVNKKCEQQNCMLVNACLNPLDSYTILKHYNELDLSSGQLARLYQLDTKTQRDKNKRYDIQRLEYELQELLDNNSVDNKTVATKLATIGNLRTEIAKDCIDNKLSAQAVLSTEQLTQWKATSKFREDNQQPSCWWDRPFNKGEKHQNKS